MTPYRVTLIRPMVEYAIVEVDASSEEQAQSLAKALDEAEGLAWEPDYESYGVTQIGDCEAIADDYCGAFASQDAGCGECRE